MNDKQDEARAGGEKVWQAFQSQLAEAGGFLNAMFRTLLHFLRRYLLSLLIFAIIGGFIGAGIWYFTPKYYIADMTVSYVHYEKKIYADMLDKLNKLIESEDQSLLSGLLEMPVEDVSLIKTVKGLNIRREPLIDDLSTEKVPFYIEAVVSDPGILEILEPALVNYLNRTDFIQERLAYMERKSEDELRFLGHRLAIADSLSRLYIIRNEGMNDEKTITRKELLEETMQIYARIQEIRGLLKFNVNIEVLDGFVATSSTHGRGLLAMIFYGLVIGMAVRIFLLAFK